MIANLLADTFFVTARKLFVWISLLGVAGAFASPDKPSKGLAIESAASQHLETARTLAAEGKFLEALAHAQAVSLESPIVLQFTGSSYDLRIQEASQTWNQALGLEAFSLAPRGGNADVTFRFVDSLRSGSTEIAGLTDWKRQVWYGPDYQCRITGIVRARTVLPNGSPVSAGAMRHILLHELGHVLGLTDGGDGVMGPLDPDDPVLAPSQQEVRLIKVLAGEARRIRTQAPFIGVFDVRGVH